MPSLDLDQLREWGLLRVPGAVGAGQVAAARQALLKRLRALDIWPRGRRHTRPRGGSAFQEIAEISSLLRDHGDLSALISPSVTALVESVGIDTVVAHSQWLVSLPSKEPWCLNRLSWHRDAAEVSSGTMPGLQAFVLVGDIASQGGATLALAGSHLLATLSASDRDSFFTELRAGPNPTLLTSPSMMGPLRVRLIEMAGQAGDLYLMDMRVLHTPTVNARSQPRLMATARFMR